MLTFMSSQGDILNVESNFHLLAQEAPGSYLMDRHMTAMKALDSIHIRNWSGCSTCSGSIVVTLQER